MPVSAQISTGQLRLLQAKHLDLRIYLEFLTCSLHHHLLLPLLLLVGGRRVLQRLALLRWILLGVLDCFWASLRRAAVLLKRGAVGTLV